MFIFLLTTNKRSDIIMVSKERTSVRKGENDTNKRDKIKRLDNKGS